LPNRRLREKWRRIKKSPTESSRLGNPYRAILRREYPWLFNVLMVLVLGIWLGKHYFAEPLGYQPGTEALALVKVDRDLRLADAMNADGPLLRWLAGARQLQEVRRDALEVFEKLAADKSLTIRGMEAYAVIKASHSEEEMSEAVAKVLQGPSMLKFTEISRNLLPHEGAWWHAKWLESQQLPSAERSDWQKTYEEDTQRLKTRALAVRSFVWLLGISGLAFVPGAVRRFRIGLKRKRHHYGNAWPLSLGLMVFLLATLAWIGFTMVLEQSISRLPELHPAMWIFFDSGARLLPPLIAIALLFKRPTHAVKVLGIAKPIAWSGVLGMFSLLTVTDQLMRWAKTNLIANEPGGGLNLSEMGLWGLAFTLISACLLAPITEEITYRGVLFRSMNNRLGSLPAAFISSVVFALLHFYDGYGFATVAVFGFSCAALYSATGSLATVIALHVIYNAAIKIPNWIVYHAPL
jgi:membrane protease YdiL (CAAX protease family)